MHDGSPGYTMAELLTALGAAMMCSVLLALLSQWAAQMIVAQPFLIQDQMAVLQVRLYLAQSAAGAGSTAGRIWPGDVHPSAASAPFGQTPRL